MNNYCKRCGHSPCICYKHNLCPVCRARRYCPRPLTIGESARRLVMYNILNDFECKVNPKTCHNWYKPYYGENPTFVLRYFINQLCRKPPC